MGDRSEYLKVAINDCQAVIRAVDVKAGFMFVVLMSPLYNLDKLSTFFAGSTCNDTFDVAMFGVLFIAWLVAVVSLFMCVGAISNPVAHVSGNVPAGTFFGGYLFSFSLMDVFYNGRAVSSKTVEQDVESIPTDEGAVLSELSFERIKLTYIRDIKLRRIQVCVRAAFVCVCAVIVECVYRVARVL